MKHDEKLNRSKIKYVDYVSFLLGFSQAVLAYIISSYIQTATGSDHVGFFYFVSYILVLIVLFEFHKFIKKFGKSTSFFIILGMQALALLFLSMLPPTPLSLLFLVLYIFFSSLSVVCVDIMLESFSTDKKSGRIRGLHLMILDAGFLLGPFLATQLLEVHNFQAVFLSAFFITAAMLYVGLRHLRDVNHKFEGNLSVAGIFQKIIKRKDVLKVYYISFILEFFYAIMIIYSPIYLRSLGMSWEQIGLIFTIMLVPFVIFPYPAGLMADKKFGEKELLIASIFIMGITTLGIFFLNTSNILIWAGILFATRIGASMVQTLRDSYFYKRIDGHDVDLIDFFRTSLPIAYVAASLLSFLVLIHYPTQSVFVLLGITVLSGLIPAMALSDNIAEEEIKPEPIKNISLIK